MQSVAENRRPLTILFLFSLLLFALSYWIQSTAYETLNSSKIAQFLRLFSMFLVVTGGVFHLTSNSSIEWVRRNSFGTAIATGSTLLLIGYRFLIQAGIGLHPAGHNELLSSGFLYYPEDNFSYVAWATQAVNGEILFHNPYTLLEHPAVYFNPFFSVIGLTARVLHISVLPLMILTGIISSAVVILSIPAICRKIQLPEHAARWATLLAAFSSGISVPAYYLGQWSGLPVPVGADLRYMDSVLFSTFYTLPYQSFAYAIQACAVLILLRCEQDNSKNFDFALLGIVQIFSVFTRPYEWLLLIGGYAIYVALSQKRTGKQFLILSILLAATAPGVLYNWWISRQPVWESFAEITMAQEKFRLYWIAGYGLLIPLAIGGTIAIWRNRNLIGGRWITASACLAIFLLVVLNIKQVKLASCAPLFLCIAAGAGIHAVLQRIHEIISPPLKILAHAGILPAPILLFGTSLFLMLAYFHTDTIDGELITAGHSIPPGASVLCDREDGNIVPAIAGARVYAGHWALTPRYSTEAKLNLIASGVEKGDGADRNAFNRFVAEERFDFVLVHQDRPAYEWIRNSKQATLIQCYSKRCLFAILSPK